jgi:hypothetical protein
MEPENGLRTKLTNEEQPQNINIEMYRDYLHLQLGEPSSQINIGQKASLSPSVLAEKVIMRTKLKEKSGRWMTKDDRRCSPTEGFDIKT